MSKAQEQQSVIYAFRQMKSACSLREFDQDEAGYCLDAPHAILAGGTFHCNNDNMGFAFPIVTARE